MWESFSPFGHLPPFLHRKVAPPRFLSQEKLVYIYQTSEESIPGQVLSKSTGSFSSVVRSGCLSHFIRRPSQKRPVSLNSSKN
ncbi:Serine/threonine-protein phosphatase 6 regulatory ankyrin repeat subunit B [Fusarium oxysporum f. sp. albedinis]|nr:Serine/threonine-protein phosphatase 6 regulatory ankyrin repeat subunit B [Fusarium oxysporum f. sp. albedinis]